jgi:acyl-CoA thioester hydrolase
MAIWIETYRGGVAAWECDIFGHLNIAFYVERFADAGADLLERLAPGVAWHSRALATRYERELRAGEGITIRSAILAVESAGLRLGHEAVNSATGERSTLVEQRLVPAAPEHWPPLRQRLAASVAAWDDPGFTPLDLPAGQGPIAAGRDRVKAWEADGAGELSLLGYLQRCSGACLHVLDAFGATEAYRRHAQRGFATFETRLTLDSPARIGDGVVVASAILDVGSSSLRMLHRLSESQSGRRLAHFYQAGVHFNLEARRSAPWPPELREKAQELRVASAN